MPDDPRASRRHTVRVAVIGSARSGRSTLCAQLAEAGTPGAFEVVDTRDIDGSLEDLAAAVRQTAQSDIVVFVVPGYAALSRTETDFLATELLPHRLLHVILVVTHLDRVDEPERVLKSVRRQAGAFDRGLVVLTGPGRDTTEDERIRAVRHAVEEVDGAAVLAERRHQVAVRLMAETDALTALAEAAESRQAEGAAQRQAAADQEKVWQKLREAYVRRQRQLADRLIGQVDDDRDAIVPTLTRELTDAADPVLWWTGDLPRRLAELLAETGRRLEETVARRTADGAGWLELELELRTQLDVEDFAAAPSRTPLPSAVTATPPAPPRDGRNRLLRDMVRAFGPVLPPILAATRAFRGKNVLVFLAEPAVKLAVDQLDRIAGEDRRAELIRQLPDVAGRQLDEYQRAMAECLAGYEREALEQLDNRWLDWRAVRPSEADQMPGVTGLADRGRAIHDRVQPSCSGNASSA